MSTIKPHLDDVLDGEFGKALSCEERALFFTSNLRQPYPSVSPFTIPSKDDALDIRFSNITMAYLRGWELLILRLKEVTDEYKELILIFKRLQLKRVGLRIPDRDLNAVLHNKEVIETRFTDLINPILQNSPTVKNAPLWINPYCARWRGLNNISSLIMDEITHISGRIDSIQNVINVAKGWMLTMIAILTPFVINHISDYPVFMLPLVITVSLVFLIFVIRTTR